MLGESRQPLHQAHDLVVLDLDGVVYVGPEAVPGAAEGIEAARRAGAHVAFVTNNAARAPDTVAAHLTRLGVPTEPSDVVTSAQAAARLLLESHGEGAAVWVLGAEGLREAVVDAGLQVVGAPRGGASDEGAGGVGGADTTAPVAVVTGYGPDVRWSELMRAAVHIAGGLPWVASNTDHSLPTPEGRAPGHGVLVRMLSDFAGVEPAVAGKPARPLLDETVRRVGGERPVMVGDRLDTDIAGARRADMASLLVLTGVTGLDEVVAATPELRPTYLAHDLSGLGRVHTAPRRQAGGWTTGRWTVRVEGGALVVAEDASSLGDARDPGGPDDPDDWWRAVAAAAWEHLDQHGVPARVDGLLPPGARAGGR